MSLLNFIPNPVFLSLLSLKQHSMTYYPKKTAEGYAFDPLKAPGEYDGLEGVKEVTVTASDGQENICWYKAPEPGHPCIMYFHGNTGNIVDCGPFPDESGKPKDPDPVRYHRLKEIKHIAASGDGLMVVGYRGYGNNKGKPTEAGLIADALAAFDYLQQRDIDPSSIITNAHSMGAAVATGMVEALERERNISLGLHVMISPFSSIIEKALETRELRDRKDITGETLRKFIKDTWDNVARIAHITRTPVMLIHGTEDKTTGIHHMEAICEAMKATGITPAAVSRLDGQPHSGLPVADAIDAPRKLWEKLKEERTCDPSHPAINDDRIHSEELAYSRGDSSRDTPSL